MQLLTPRQISTLRRRYTLTECVYGAVLAVIVVTLFTALLLGLLQRPEIYW